MTPEPGASVGGRYRLEHHLAQGGMGSVWLATHLALDAPVAIKFIDESMAHDEEWRSRFGREAKTAAALRSPHVVQILDYGNDEGGRYIAMELLEGENLHERLKRRGRLSLPEASTILSQVCAALAVAAGRGILHRDLKPANIFLSRIGDEETVKVLDFGVAKDHRAPVESLQTLTGTLVGTPHYMSPEQTRGTKALDHRSDLWSLAVILYRMITGERPFEGDVLGDLILKIHSAEVTPPTVIVPDLPPAVDRFFERALCRDRDGRFQTARELALAFAQVTEEAPAATLAYAQTVTEQIVPVAEEDERTRKMTTEDVRLSDIRRWPTQKRLWWYAAVVIEVLIIVAAFWLGGSGDEAALPPSSPSEGAVVDQPP